MGGMVISSNPSRVRIKGHWQSAVRFFLIAVGFMISWLLITSELSYFSKWLGPSILLEMNLAFYLPSLPILLISSHMEKAMDSAFGPMPAQAARILIGLSGSMILCALFPFITAAKDHAKEKLLAIIAALGTFSAIAFSTSYQLATNFRHADVIALGIGGVGSGQIVLLIQLCLANIGSFPARWQWIAQFEITAGFVFLGLISCISLYWQYWTTLCSSSADQDVLEPLLAANKEAEEEGHLPVRPPPPLPPPTLRETTSAPIPKLDHARRDSHRYSDDGVGEEERWHMSLALARTKSTVMHPDPYSGGIVVPFVFARNSVARWNAQEDEEEPLILPSSRKPPSAPAVATDGVGEGLRGEDEKKQAASSLDEMKETLVLIWPVLMSFLLSVTILYLLFPLFTYVQSSPNGVGDNLPRVLFFTRIGADVVGRFSPRIKILVPRSPSLLLTITLVKTVVAALFLAYIKAPDYLIHDSLPICAVVFIWLIGGYINTCANILAPAIVPDRLAMRASALLALVFQAAHFLGLILAALFVFIVFGDIVG